MRFKPEDIRLAVIPILFLLSTNCNKEAPLPPQVSSQIPNVETINFKAVRKFSGRGDQRTKAVHISGNKVKLIGRCWGSLDNTYTSFELKGKIGKIANGSAFTIHTEGLENGHGEYLVSNIVPGDYFISVMTNMNWEVVIYEGTLKPASLFLPEKSP